MSLKSEDDSKILIWFESVNRGVCSIISGDQTARAIMSTSALIIKSYLASGDPHL